MAELLKVNPDSPQLRTISQIVTVLRSGGVMLYPTDTLYAIGCDLNCKAAVQRVRQIKQIANDKPLTFLCSSLSNIAMYAQVDNQAYRFMKSLIPGAYTFILPATKLVPKLVMNPKRKTTGIRVPDHNICLALLEALENPIISTSAPILAGQNRLSHFSSVELFDHFTKLVDVIIDDGLELEYGASTVIDLTEFEPQVIRQGVGKLPSF